MDQPTFKGETSDDLVKDDPNLKEPQPSAPPIGNMDHINGYDGVTFGGGWCSNILSNLPFYTPDKPLSIVSCWTFVHV